MENIDIINKIKSLNLPLGQYVVGGSSVMQLHGIRKAKDIDIVIIKDLYSELKRRGLKRHWFFRRFLTCRALKHDGVEAFTNLRWKTYRTLTDEIIRNAELISGIPFVSLKDHLAYKKHLPRAKDTRDVELMEKYLKV